MAQIAQETRASVASALLRPDTKGGQVSAYACRRIGSWPAPLRFAIAIAALSATSAFAACFVLRADEAQNNQTKFLQKAHKAATAGAQRCWNSARASALLLEKGVMSPSVFSLDFPANDEQGTCSMLRARDATDDDCTMFVTVGGGGYFRLLHSGLYYVTVQVTVEAEAESGRIELIVVRWRPRSGNMGGEKGGKKVGNDRRRSCRGNVDRDASYETALSTAKVTLPGASVGGVTAAKANTTLYTSKLATFLSGDEISLNLRCFGFAALGNTDRETEGCRVSVGGGSFLGLVPVELSIN